MKYTKQQRLDIGREMVDEGLTCRQAADRYGICESAVGAYRRDYLASIGAKPPRPGSKAALLKAGDIESLEGMTRDELIDQVILARAEAERAKKGYSAKGGGARKEFVPLKGPSSK